MPLDLQCPTQVQNPSFKIAWILGMILVPSFPTNDPESLPWHRTCLALYHRRLFYLLPAVYRRQSTWSWGGLTLAHKVITQAASCLGSKLQIWCFVIFFRMFSKFAACKNMDRPLVQHKKSTNQYTLIVPRFMHLLDASYQFKKIHVLSSLTVILTPYSPWNKSSGVFENSVPSCPSEHQRSCMLLSWPHLISCRRLAVKLLQRHALGDSQEFDAPKAVQTYPPKI